MACGHLRNGSSRFAPAAPLAGALLIPISAVPVSCCAHLSAPDVWQLVVLGAAASITLSRRECTPAVNFSFERNRRGCLKVMCGGPPGNRTLHRAGFLDLLISQATCRSIREQPLQSRQPTQMHPARPTTHHPQFLRSLRGDRRSAHPVAALCAAMGEL